MNDFNLNEYVLVKLTDKGYQYLTDMHNELQKEYPSMEKVWIDHFQSKADKEGYSRFQMWDFMEKFGHFGICMSEYINLNIKLIRK